METISAALIAALAALGGVWLEKVWKARSDVALWEREEARRRRIRGEEVAREVRRVLHEAARPFEDAWASAKYRSANWQDPPDELVEGITQRAMDLSVEIPDEDVRLFVRNATNALMYADDANQGGAPPPWIVAQAVDAETDSVIGAYLRGERIPAATEVEAAVQAAGQWRAQINEWQDQQQAEWTARRAAKRQAELDTSPSVKAPEA